MSHHIYHTRGVILGSTPNGESNRFYKIFTEELGLVAGTAQSVREGKSKLRYTLQDFSFVTVDLVRGKEVWRIISAGANRPPAHALLLLLSDRQWRAGPLEAIKNDVSRLKLFARFCALLVRLLHGEGRDHELFDEITQVADFLEAQTIPQELALSFETLTTLRVLAHLGYVDPAGYEKFLTPNMYSADILEDFEKVRLGILPKITASLDASHL